ncbi:MAG: VWA domain-containing protein [Acidobacteriia bacterium]|nr:VWA domain-containing protein [Terriglobia bacterium]
MIVGRSSREKLGLVGCLGLALAALGLASLGPVLSWAQRPAAPARATLPQTASSYIITSQTNVVLVDVRVVDKGGKLVTDLQQSDFRLWEDGVAQTITSFSLEDIERLAQAGTENGPPAVIDLSKLPPNVTPAEVVRDRRLTVLFFDLTSLAPEDLIRASKAADDFVRERLSPADLVAVVSYTSSLRVLQDFTNDRDALEKALKSIRIGEESSNLAEAGTEGEAGGTNASGQEIVAQDVSAAFTPDETEFNIFNTDEKLAAIESLARMLRAIPGRKSLIHFSSGVERTGIENQAQLRAATDAANQANLSLYTVDSRGLAALPPGGDASTASPSGTAIYSGQAIFSQVSALQGSRETLASLAADTGGKTFYDLNDFSPAFAEVQKENSSYYLLGYTPSNLRSDGRFRRIRVEVDRPGVKVEARSGYFAPKNFRQFTAEDKELQLEQAMNLDLPFVDLPFVVEASYFRRNDRKYDVVLAAKIPGSVVPFQGKSEKHETAFDFAWRVTDDQNRAVGALRDTLPVKVAGEAYEMLLAGNILYEGKIQLPPGQYRLKAVVRENQSGKMGTFEGPLILPQISDAGLSLSSVVLSNEVKSPDNLGSGAGRRGKEAGTNGLIFGNRAVLPSVTRVFRGDQTLSIYLESYAGKKEAPSAQDGTPASDSGSPPAVAVVFFRGGRRFAEAGPFVGKPEKSSSGKAVYFVQIPLEKFPPGRYTLQTNVLDPSANCAAFARTPLAVVRPLPRTSGASSGGQ